MATKSESCFGYRCEKEIVRLNNGRAGEVLREYCSALSVMQCRRKKDARKACRFFKTRAEFIAGQKKYGGEKEEVKGG